MAFRARMRVAVSNAEMQIREELQRRGIHLNYDEVIIFYQKKTKILRKEKVTKDIMQTALGYTLPDGRKRKLVFYFDGPPHLRSSVKERDDRIDSELRERGFKPHRFSYGGRLSERRKKEICDSIEVLEGS